MTKKTEPPIDFFTILMAEDDPDDRFIAEQAFQELGFFGQLRFVEDGEELMHYLHLSGKYSDRELSPLPDLILLDLNMPKKDGRKALVEIKNARDLQHIPVTIWTTSTEDKDKIECINMGADIFFTKPADYTDLLNSLRCLIEKYCLKSGN